MPWCNGEKGRHSFLPHISRKSGGGRLFSQYFFCYSARCRIMKQYFSYILVGDSHKKESPPPCCINFASIANSARLPPFPIYRRGEGEQRRKENIEVLPRHIDAKEEEKSPLASLTHCDALFCVSQSDNSENGPLKILGAHLRLPPPPPTFSPLFYLPGSKSPHFYGPPPPSAKSKKNHHPPPRKKNEDASKQKTSLLWTPPLLFRERIPLFVGCTCEAEGGGYSRKMPNRTEKKEPEPADREKNPGVGGYGDQRPSFRCGPVLRHCERRVCV